MFQDRLLFVGALQSACTTTVVCNIPISLLYLFSEPIDKDTLTKMIDDSPMDIISISSAVISVVSSSPESQLFQALICTLLSADGHLACCLSLTHTFITHAHTFITNRWDQLLRRKDIQISYNT